MRGKSKSGSDEPIEFKGTTLPVVSVLLHSLDLAELSAALEKRLGRTPDFFSGDAALLDICGLHPPPDQVDWQALRTLLRRYNLSPVAARAPETLTASAQAVGLAPLSATEPPARAPSGTASQAELWSEPARAPAVAAPQEATPPHPTAANPTLIVDKPLRSGQQIYARGGDLVVLAMVSAGAEVIADGSIHVYAPLRGRALAGARGYPNARIFATRFEAELVSVAGVYRTFERGVSPEVAGKPAQVRLNTQGEKQSLTVEPLNIG